MLNARGRKRPPKMSAENSREFFGACLFAAVLLTILTAYTLSSVRGWADGRKEREEEEEDENE